MAEAIKVALIKDAGFFNEIEADAPALAARNMPAMERQIHRCAEMHLQHIAGRSDGRTPTDAGDPFEMGSSRPLDFGHWSAHKLEQLTNFEMRHGEAVAIGIALDSLYSQALGWLTEADTNRILTTLRTLGFTLYHPALDADDSNGVLKGLTEFREHLGGRLTIMLLKGIGRGVEVHDMNPDLIRQAIATLSQQESQAQLA